MKKTKNTRVTSIHGSMEAQNIVKEVELIENGKKKKQDQKEKKKQEKDKEKEQFYKCKSKCVCAKCICAIKGFKECPAYHELKNWYAAKRLEELMD